MSGMNKTLVKNLRK